jgi:hypothetical protein
MLRSLARLEAALQCPLCHHVLTAPMTLSCAHSFCCQCIDAYACDHWHCPMEGCGLALTLHTKGSFRKVNPTLDTLVSSFHTMVDTLSRAPDAWWKEGGEPGDDEDDPPSQEDDDDGLSDESIDLQQPQASSPASSRHSQSADDDDDDESDTHELL